jgi:ABC-type phosphate transport system permease subunit
MPSTRSHIRHAGLLSNLLALALLTLPLPTQASSEATDAAPYESHRSALKHTR